MKKIKKINKKKKKGKMTLRELIGDIKSTKEYEYNEIHETTKGCFTDLEEDQFDMEVEINQWGIQKGGNTAEIYSFYRGSRRLMGNVYLENGVPKIISTYPGDERGCIVFGDVFISSGHDGNYLWNIKTGEFVDNTW